MLSSENFALARVRVMGDVTRKTNIGSLSEKTLHRVLKYTIEPNEEFHEIKYLGSVADIMRDGEIYEIQTRNFEHLVPKLEKFLDACTVTVVYPLAKTSTIRTVNRDTGEISRGRKSPKHAAVHDCVWELYKIRRFLSHSAFRLKLVFLDVDEYRYEDKTKRSRRKYSALERLPNRIESERDFLCREDYLEILPQSLISTAFTRRDIARELNCTSTCAWGLVRILLDLGLVCEAGKNGRSVLYRVSQING